MSDRQWSAATRAIASGRPNAVGSPLNTPIVPATAYLDDGAYARAGNPTWASFEAVLGELEDGEAVSFSSGNAAMSAALGVLIDRLAKPTATIAHPEVLYSGTRALLGALADDGRATLVAYRGSDPDGTADRTASADIVVVESPSNPLLDVTDIAAVVRGTSGAVLVDNTVATPILTRPLALGATMVVHSASKYLAGHSDALMGAVTCREPMLTDHLRAVRTRQGAVPGTLEAFLATRGLRTLDLRMQRACANAATLAARLNASPFATWVGYPGLPDHPGHAAASRQMALFGALVAMRPAGGLEAADALPGATTLWLDATSFGGVESTWERRRRHPEESDGVPPDLLRLSVGCEDVEDLWDDLARALAQVHG